METTGKERGRKRRKGNVDITQEGSESMKVMIAMIANSTLPMRQWERENDDGDDNGNEK